MDEHIIREQVLECTRLQSQGFTRAEISRMTGLSERQVKRRLSREFRNKYIKNRNHDNTINFMKDGDNQNIKFNEVENVLGDELFSRFVSEEKRREIWERTRTRKETPYLVLNDLHVPFHDSDKVQQATDFALNNGIRRVVVNGDLLDLFAVSSFARDKNIDLKKEYETGLGIVEVLSELFDEVYLVEGNHERRIKNWTYKNINPDMLWLFRVDLLDQIAKEFNNVYYAGGWWMKIGTVIFAHPNNFSSIPGRTTVNTSDHFRSRNEFHTGIILGHTHKVFNAIHKGVAMMETGCLCYDMDYLTEKGNFTADPWVRAFGVVTVDADGHMDYNKSTVVYLD